MLISDLIYKIISVINFSYYLFNGLKDVYDVKFNEKRFPELQKKLRFMKAPTVYDTIY